MKTAPRRSPADRDRAVARLRALTIGTGIASVAAVGGFSVLAAHTYDGTSTDILTAAVTTVSPTSSSTSASTSSGTTTSTSLGTTSAPTTTTSTAHAASGSS